MIYMYKTLKNMIQFLIYGVANMFLNGFNIRAVLKKWV